MMFYHNWGVICEHLIVIIHLTVKGIGKVVSELN